MMLRSWRLAPWGAQRWPNFKPRELACRCRAHLVQGFCDGEYWHDEKMLDALQTMRTRIGRPLVINSGHRCGQWNALVGGAPLSQHRKLAVDVDLDGHDPRTLFNVARDVGFTGFGFHAAFLHLDMRSRGAVWTYGGKSLAVWRPFLEEGLWKTLEGSRRARSGVASRASSAR